MKIKSWSELTDIRLNRVRVNEVKLYLQFEFELKCPKQCLPEKMNDKDRSCTVLNPLSSRNMLFYSKCMVILLEMMAV